MGKVYFAGIGLRSPGLKNNSKSWRRVAKIRELMLEKSISSDLVGIIVKRSISK